MPTIFGLRGTGQFGPNERPQNFREYILWRRPNGSAPLFALTSKSKTEATDDPVFHWWEEDVVPPRFAVFTPPAAAGGAPTPAGIPAPAAAGTTQLTLGPVNAANAYDPNLPAPNIVPGMLLKVEASVLDPAAELMLVTAVTPPAAGSNLVTVTVQRGFGGTAAAAVAAPAGGGALVLTGIGNAHPEGALSPQSVSRNPIEFFNYTQIFRTTYRVTNTAKASRYRTGDPLANERRRKTFDHARDIEYALLFGRRSTQVDPATNQIIRTTGGLVELVQTNRVNFAAPGAGGAGGGGPVFNLQNFIDAVAPVFNYETPAGRDRLVLCGNAALNAINRIISTSPNVRINYDRKISVYGVELTEMTIPQGRLFFYTHPLFNENPVFSSWAFIIDPSGIYWRPLRGRDTHKRDNIQPPDADYIMGEWITEGGFELHNERAFAILTGLV